MKNGYRKIRESKQYKILLSTTDARIIGLLKEIDRNFVSKKRSRTSIILGAVLTVYSPLLNDGVMEFIWNKYKNKELIPPKGGGGRTFWKVIEYELKEYSILELIDRWGINLEQFQTVMLHYYNHLYQKI